MNVGVFPGKDCLGINEQTEAGMSGNLNPGDADLCDSVR